MCFARNSDTALGVVVNEWRTLACKSRASALADKLLPAVAALCFSRNDRAVLGVVVSEWRTLACKSRAPALAARLLPAVAAMCFSQSNRAALGAIVNEWRTLTCKSRAPALAARLLPAIAALCFSQNDGALLEVVVKEWRTIACKSRAPALAARMLPAVAAMCFSRDDNATLGVVFMEWRAVVRKSQADSISARFVEIANARAWQAANYRASCYDIHVCSSAFQYWLAVARKKKYAYRSQSVYLLRIGDCVNRMGVGVAFAAWRHIVTAAQRRRETTWRSHYATCAARVPIMAAMLSNHHGASGQRVLLHEWRELVRRNRSEVAAAKCEALARSRARQVVGCRIAHRQSLSLLIVLGCWHAAVLDARRDNIVRTMRAASLKQLGRTLARALDTDSRAFSALVLAAWARAALVAQCTLRAGRLSAEVARQALLPQCASALLQHQLRGLRTVVIHEWQLCTRRICKARSEERLSSLAHSLAVRATGYRIASHRQTSLLDVIVCWRSATAKLRHENSLEASRTELFKQLKSRVLRTSGVYGLLDCAMLIAAWNRATLAACRQRDSQLRVEAATAARSHAKRSIMFCNQHELRVYLLAWYTLLCRLEELRVSRAGCIDVSHRHADTSAEYASAVLASWRASAMLNKTLREADGKAKKMAVLSQTRIREVSARCWSSAESMLTRRMHQGLLHDAYCAWSEETRRETEAIVMEQLQAAAERGRDMAYLAVNFRIRAHSASLLVHAFVNWHLICCSARCDSRVEFQSLDSVLASTAQRYVMEAVCKRVLRSWWGEAFQACKRRLEHGDRCSRIASMLDCRRNLGNMAQIMVAWRLLRRHGVAGERTDCVLASLLGKLDLVRAQAFLAAWWRIAATEVGRRPVAATVSGALACRALRAWRSEIFGASRRRWRLRAQALAREALPRAWAFDAFEALFCGALLLLWRAWCQQLALDRETLSLQSEIDRVARENAVLRGGRENRKSGAMAIMEGSMSAAFLANALQEL
eukprot:TRINITY_DN16520_c0_g1_i1.p1 TRINITY_DN16520_c0_g1~~TRINITY_DN16520_c0_g1_i1.p1  ORF type:complete len:1016 (-),score=143.63 TRINITY_DN16520_c0_g1_i1:88-3078(-)